MTSHAGNMPITLWAIPARDDAQRDTIIRRRKEYHDTAGLI